MIMKDKIDPSSDNDSYFKYPVDFNHKSETKRGLGGRTGAVKRRNAAIRWCNDQKLLYRWRKNESLWRFYFHNEEDAVLFKLAWGI